MSLYRLVLISAMWIITFFAFSVYDTTVDPAISTNLAIQQVNGGDVAAAAVRTYNHADSLKWVFLLIAAGVTIIECKPLFKKGFESMKKFLSVFVLFVGCISMFGCQPYEEPQYEVVENNETAFVVPLEGDVNAQAKFASAESLEQFKVATKRIRVVRRWDQTGRMWFDGAWIPKVRVLKVNRTPVTRQWISPKVGEGNGIWVESSDSVGFSTGFVVVGAVEENDTALFLYSYRNSTLDAVMDGEVRARVQSIVSSVSSRYKMDLLREKKEEMTEEIKRDIIPFFKAKGITITTIGNFGGFTYENPKIQDSIDNVFIAQQEKNVAAASLAAQKDKNERLRQEGEGEAAKFRAIAQGKADAAKMEAEGQAAAVKMVADAAKTAGSDPTFLSLKRIEVTSEAVKRWDGKYPVTMMSLGGKDTPQMLLQLPSVDK